MRAVIFLLLLGLTAGGQAADTLATMAKVQGKVEILPLEGFRREAAEAGRALKAGEAVLTGEEASAVVAFADGSRVALDAGTRLELAGPDEVRQKGGKAYYRIESREQQGRTVRTEFSVIGVKGTEFLVRDESEGKAVALEEGDVAIESPEGRYKLYRKKQKAAFQDYMERQKEAFESYKEQMQREFVGYARSFDMASGQMATFSGNEATTGAISADLQGEIERLRGML